jgi:phosphatidylinositol alpha-1,6-mannosyltransferase
MTRRPRVLLITPDFPPAFGGIQVVADRIATLASRVEIRVVTTGERHPQDDERGFEVIRAPGAGHRVRLLQLTGRAIFAGMGWADLVISGHVVCAPAAAALRATRHVPVVQYFYGQEIPNRPRLASFAARRATCIISISDYTSGLLAQHAPRSAPISHIPPGVDLPIPRAIAGDREPTIVTVGRLRDRYKGHDVLLRAMATLKQVKPEARLVIVGDGPLRSELEQYSHELGVDDVVRFAGQVDDAERNRILECASVFCMPSRVREDGAGEGFGIVYMEASARELPVIAGSVGGARDAVVDGETGLLVDPEDPNAVTQALRTLLDNPGLARNMGVAGRRRAEAFSWPLIVKRVEDLVLTLLPASGRPTTSISSLSG